MFDPNTYPLADFGLRCRDCDYPLANLTVHRCAECGRPFTLEEFVPDGAFPPLYADGGEVRLTAQVQELLETYGLPHATIATRAWGVLGGLEALSDRRGKPIAVPRDRYFEAIDLLRRNKLGEPMPPPPPPEPTEDWPCPRCGETSPGNFDVCWQCGAERGG